MQYKIGMLGAGNMAEAIAGALIRAEIVKPSDILVNDISPERLDLFQRNYAIGSVADTGKLLEQCDTIILAVKPQQLLAAVTQMIETADLAACTDRRLIISIAAGIRISKLESIVYAGLNESERDQFPIVRVMPNTPALVLAGIAGLSGNAYAAADDLALARRIFEATGQVVDVAEAELDAVTAMSGSGPAYVFYFIEAMIAAGVSLGFDQATARDLTVATMSGALKLVAETGESPTELRRKVTSPGGTTQAALELMQQGAFMETVIRAIQGAAKRSEELSR